MNNIYKVIWSKAKNCYVVASEIARSHTKSASGSEKIGGVARHALLALGAACAIACGGFVNVGAVEYEHVDVTTTGTSTATVYTKNGTEAYVENALSHFDTKDEVNQKIETLKTGDVATNKNDIAALQATTIDQGQKIATNTANIANNKDAIDKKIDKETANATYATKEALNNLTTTVNGKADLTALEAKADKTYVDQKFTEAGTSVDTKLANYATTAYVDGKIADEVNARDNKITAAIGQERTDRDAAINTAIAKEVADRNQAIDTAIAQEVTDRNLAVTNAKTELQGKITEEETARKAADVELTGKITAEETARTNADNALDNRLTTAEGKIGANETAIGDLKAKDTVLEGKITTLDGKVTTDITGLQAKDTELAGKIQTNANNIQTNKNDITTIKQRTAGIDRIDARHETTIEGHVTVDDHGNVTADGKLKAGSVDAGTGDITTTGAVNAGSLNVTDASHLKGDVTMDKTLSVTGDTSLGALNVTGESSLKNTQVNGTLTTTGKATFKEAVDMDKGLTVTSGDTTLQNTDVKGALNVTGESNLKNTTVDGTLSVNKETTLNDKLTANGEATFGNDVTVKGTTNLKNTTVDGDLKVTGTITTDKMVFGDKPINYTEIDHGKVTSKNLEVNGAGQAISSSSTFDVEKNEVGFGNGITGDHSYHKQTAKGINGSVTDKDGNKTYTKVTATENSFQVQDKDGKNKNHQVNTKDSSVTEITNEEGKTTKTEQTAKDITNTAKDGTITNDAQTIVNKANGDMTNTVGGKLTTTVTGQATENFNSGLDTNVTGKENHTVTGDQNIHVTGKQTNEIGGDQENTIGGNQTTTVEGNVKEDYKKDLTTTVGGNELHEVTGTKTENVTGKVTENYKAGQETNVTGDQVNIIGGNQTTTVTGDISNKAENITNEANTKLTDKVDDNTRVLDSEGITDTVPGADGKGSTFKQRIDAIMGNVKTADGESEVTQKGDEITSKVGLGEATNSRVTQKKDMIESAVTDGTNTNDRVDTASASAKKLTDGTRVNKLQDNLDSSEKTITNGTYKTSKLQTALDITNTAKDGTITNDAKNIVNNATGDMTNIVGGKLTTTVTGQATENFNGGLNTKVTGAENHTVTGKQTNTVGGGQINNITGGQINNITGDQTTTVTGMVTENYKAGQATNVTGNQDIHVTGKQTNKIDGNQENTIGGDQTTNVTGDILNTAKNITNAATETLTDKVGTNTRVINSRSITDTVGRANRMIEDGKITDNAGDFTVTTDKENGTTFTNAGSTASSFTTVDGRDTGSARESTNIKGNEISTGKVEANYVKMDYADVMHDLGVHGSATVDNDLTVKGITTTKTLKVTENAEIDGTLKVAKKATFEDSVSIAKDLSVGGDVTANSYKVGDKTYISAAGINANDQKITNVADGSISEGSKDAVNGGQLYGVKRDLEHQVDKVGANAAAMANLRPMEFDPSSKWNIAAAIGNYGSETAAALGAFYRPNDDVMVNLSTAFGTGENMVGGGVSVRLGKSGNKLSREETNALKAQVDDLTARMDALLSVLNPNMSKDFPDVPENHWAYEAVSRLAGNDIVQGYPDGEFHGERTMTRYEMAEIIYNALSRGAEAEKELVEEFKPELQAMAASEKATAERAEG